MDDRDTRRGAWPDGRRPPRHRDAVPGVVGMTAAAWLIAAALAAAAPQQQNHAADDRSRPVTLDPGLSGAHHAIQTANADAQKFFDQGLTLVYAFNHEEAVRSFG